MTKKEAVEKFVERDFNGIPQDWVQIVAEKLNAEIYTWPMWGTMWLVSEWLGKKLMANAKQVVECEKHADINDGENPECKDCADYNEEMLGAWNIKDKDGNGTAAYIYEVDGQFVMGINGAGWNFYNGVWDRLYDLLGLEWHDTKCTHYQCNNKRDETLPDAESCAGHQYCKCGKVAGKHYKRDHKA